MYSIIECIEYHWIDIYSNLESNEGITIKNTLEYTLCSDTLFAKQYIGYRVQWSWCMVQWGFVGQNLQGF